MSRSALGDYLRASRRLGLTDAETHRAVAALVGLRLPDAPPPAAPAPSGPRPAAARPTPVPPRSVGAPPAPPPPASPALAPAGPPYARPPAAATVPSTLAPVGTAPVVLPAWLPEVEALALPAEGPEPERPRPESLLDPRQSRTILFDSLSSRVADGPVDVERLVRARAAGHPLATLPRQSRATMSRGVQVLVDLGEGMLPFLDDVRQLLSRVRAVAGAGVTVLHFEGVPQRGAGGGGRWCWRPYEELLPAPGTVVLAVTDLGLGGGRLRRGTVRSGEWVALAGRLRGHGCPLRVVVPYPPARWPPGLRQEMGIIPWDRGTGARLVHRLLRDHAWRGAP